MDSKPGVTRWTDGGLFHSFGRSFGYSFNGMGIPSSSAIQAVVGLVTWRNGQQTERDDMRGEERIGEPAPDSGRD